MAEKEKTYPVLKVGSKGPEVKMLKIALKEKGYDVDLSTDEYDNNTKEIVEKVQQEDPAKMNKDGIVGEQTWSYLEADLGKELLNPVVNTADAKPPYKWIDVKESSVKPDINTLNNLATYQTGTILGDKPTSTTTTQNQNGKINPNAKYENWSTNDLTLLNTYNPKWNKEQGISPYDYADFNSYKQAREEWLAKQNSPTGTEEGNISDDATRAIMESMGRNIEANKKDIMGNRAFNDAISLGELMHNINEAKYAGEPVKEPMMIVGDRMSAKASLDSIDRSKAAQVKQLASVGRQDLIPSVLKEADNKKLEVMQNVENANAQIGNQIKQINQQTYNQGIELGMRGNQFDAQMLAQQEALRGASESQNIENIRKTATDYTNSMTMNKDNKLSYDIYAAALKDPELMKSINTFMDMMNRRTKK